MRVGIIGLMHESNTFINSPTTIENFHKDQLLAGPAVRQAMAVAHHEVGGFFEGLEAHGIEAAPIFHASATPSGVVTDDALQKLLAVMLQGLNEVGPLDGLLVAPHGAGVSEKERDMDGHWLTLLRQRLGPDMPIICTLDLHANISPRMIAACNASIAYRCNPHIDQRQRGVEAARLMARTLRGQVRPTQAAAYPPVAINIERQRTSEPPCRPMYELAERMLERPGVLSTSIILGFPYADVPEMGSAFTAVTDNDPALAQACADEMARYLVQHRQEFVAHLIDVEEALDQAAASERPVLLLDMGDNVGGGSAADGTFLAHALHRRGAVRPLRAFVCLADPQAVQQASAAGAGARLDLTIGGKTDDQHGPPLNASFTVKSLHDGRFRETQPRHGGKVEYDMGPTAIVESDTGLTVMLTTRRIAPFSLQQLISCGLDPARFDVLVAKGVQAPVAAYAPVCPTIIRVNTPGSTTADMHKLTYRHRRRPLFPFEELGAA